MSIERVIASITEDRRAEYLWPTKPAARCVGCHPNKFYDWWRRNKRKLVALAAAMPGETAAELAGVIALGLAAAEKSKEQPCNTGCGIASATASGGGSPSTATTN